MEAEIQEVEAQIQGSRIRSAEAGKESLADYWRKKEEQLRKEEEQLRKEKEQLRKEKEQLRKEEELLRKEKELLRKEKELLRKEKELLRKEKEQLHQAPANIPISPVELQDSQQMSSWLLRGSEASRTRSASKIAVEDFLILRQALKLVVRYEDINGNTVAPEILESLVGEDKFWDPKYVYERQEKDKYIAEVKRWVPEVEIFWADVNGHSINTSFPRAPFPVSGQNDQLAFVKGMGFEQGALLGVDLRRKVLTMNGLRQAEVNFYLWGDCSLLPFVQVITDMHKGGVAMYCRSRSRRSNKLALVQVVLRTMDEVKQFTQKVLSNPLSVEDAHYNEVPSEGLEPPRKRFRPL